jgi:2-dehydropantoate 2-reductase
LAVFLKLANKNVILIRRIIDYRSSHREKLRVKLHDTKEFEAEIEVGTVSNFSVLEGLVVLTNKSYGNDHIARH